MIIGFSGKMGVGKSTAISAIADAVGSSQVKLVKFAQPLYDLQEAAYAIISPVYARPSSFVKDRKLLQWLGTEWGRGTISSTIWVDLWRAKATSFDPSAVVVCDDVRFDNEAEVIKSLGGVIIGITGASRGAEVGIAGHASEAGITPTLIDYVLHNEGNREQFKDEVYDLFQRIRK